MFVLYTRYYKYDQIKENEVGNACSTLGRNEKYVYSFSLKTKISLLGRPSRRREGGSIKIYLKVVRRIWIGFM